MKVSELAKKANVTSETIRYYTREGLIIASVNPENNYKYYDDYQLKRLQFICKARSLGFCIKDIKSIFEKVEDGCSPCPIAREILAIKIQKYKNDADELNNKIRLMQSTLDEWNKEYDVIPDNKIICPLIEGEENDFC